MQVRRPRPVLWLMLAAVVLGCARKPLYHHYHHVGTDGWQRADTLVFQLPPSPHGGHYLVSLGLRYAPSYPYEGLTIVAETLTDAGAPPRLDTLRVATSSPQGVPLGHGVSLMQQQLPIFHLRLAPGSGATIRLRHIMAREVLPDFRDIGLLVEEKKILTTGNSF